ncbi:MAG: universal stress protein [Bradyrhizobium sp.]
MTINPATGFRRILLAIDDSLQSAAATASVEAMASGGGAEVLVLHVWDANAAERHGESREAADQLVAAVAARLSAQGIAADAKVCVSGGDVADEIEAMAAEYHPDLVAMGSRGRGDLAGLTLGSVSHRVIHRIDCAILLGRDRDSGSDPQVTRILLALAGNASDSAAIDLASGIALSHKSSVLVLHVLRSLMDGSSSGYLQPLEAVAEVLRPAVRILRERGLDAEELVVPGSAAAMIVETAQANHAGLIVLGPGRRPSDLTGLLLGDKTSEVVHLSDRTVLIAAAKPRHPSAQENAGGTERKKADGWGAGLEGKY